MVISSIMVESDKGRRNTAVVPHLEGRCVCNRDLMYSSHLGYSSRRRSLVDVWNSVDTVGAIEVEKPIRCS